MGGVIVVFICVIGAMIWGGIYAGKKRRDAMTLLAEKLGLSFHFDRDYRLVERYGFLDDLDQGSNRYAYNVLSGTYRDHSIVAFDYHYETHSTDQEGKEETDDHHFSFFILTLDDFFPELTITKEGLFSKIAQAVGYDDIAFENHEFSRKFVVRSKDEKFAHDFCTVRMIDYLQNHPNINIELDQNQLAVGYTHCLKVEEIEPHLNRLIEIRELMPDFLFED